MKKITVSICGSSATRGCFELHNLKEFNDIIDVVNMQYLSSFISLMSDSFSGKIDIDGNTSEWNKKVIRRDLSKEYLNELKELQPQYIIIDFISDILYGTLKFDNEIITNNKSKLKDVKFENKGIVFDINSNYEEYINELLKSTLRFIEYVKLNLPNTKVIIHSARFIRSYYDSGNICRLFNAYDTYEKNKILDEIESKLKRFGLDNININNEKYCSNEGHKWKKNRVHYEQKYYRDFLLNLYRVIINDLLLNNI